MSVPARLRPLTHAEIARRITVIERHAGATIIATDEERAAREVIESRRGVPYAEAEWKEAAANLRAFFGLLTEWKRNEGNPSRRNLHQGQ